MQHEKPARRPAFLLLIHFQFVLDHGCFFDHHFVFKIPDGRLAFLTIVAGSDFRNQILLRNVNKHHPDGSASDTIKRTINEYGLKIGTGKRAPAFFPPLSLQIRTQNPPKAV